MSQVLVTFENHWYQSIASIRDYSEPNYEEKILKYGTGIFSSHYVLKCDFSFLTKNANKDSYKPDFLLISKNLKSWIIVEVELCRKALTHTFKQLKCFSDPDFDSEKLLEYLLNQPENSSIAAFKAGVKHLLENHSPKLLVIYDDYCLNTFETIRAKYKDIDICVIEVYRTSEHISEAYRISGDYPYDISGISPLKFIDNQHYEITRPRIFDEFDIDIDIEMLYYMRRLKGRFLRTGSKMFLKLAFNPMPGDAPVQLQKDSLNRIIIKRV
jgi:hypothetical protein